MSSIQVQLPDGSVREVPSGTTPLAIAESISPRLAQASVVARIRPLKAAAVAASSADGSEAAMYGTEDTHAERLVDLTKPLQEDVALQLLTEKAPEALKVLRHSAAHVMATAVTELFPETKLGHGPATDAGFFYDFWRPTPFTPEDLKLIEGRMAEVTARDEKFIRELEPREQGLESFKAGNDFMKVHFVEKFTKPGDEISLYRNGKFVDFCRGPHVPSTGRVKAFKVMSLSGAYWLGDEKNPQLQRIYGTAFFSKKDLDEYLERIEDAKRRDHRRLGKELELFTVSDEVGAGLPLWLPKGATIRRLLEEYILGLEREMGYEHVYTPSLAKVGLYIRSGHWEHYHEDMFPTMDLKTEELVLRPMNCPHHILIYESKLRSYRDLPVRLAELGTMYRYERSGVLSGLSRVRCMTLNDAHIFCTPEQIEDEIASCLDFALDVLKDFGFDQFQTELSTWNPDDRRNFVGSEEQWIQATQSLEKVLKRKNVEYKTIPGEAAFYGPKIDIKLVDAIGRLWQLSTVQFDFNLPQRFGLEYVAEDGSRKQPVMVHRALYGSVERFFGVLIEHYAGAFPVWLSPVQVAMIPISERHVEYANKIADQLKAIGVRVVVDARNEKMNAKIREHAMQKVPFLLVVGDKEAEAGKVNVRTRGKEKTEDMAAPEFVEKIRKLIADKSPGL